MTDDEKIKDIEEFVNSDKPHFLIPWIVYAEHTLFLLSHIKKLQIDMVSHFQREHLEGDGPEIDRWKRRVKELEEQIYKFEQRLDLEKLSYSGLELLLDRERTRIKELEDGIKKHKKDKQNMIRQAHAPNSGSYLDPWDKELYKLVEGK